jgi:hypothetical protein
VLLLELTLLRRHKLMSPRMKAPQGTVCMSLMLVADVVVAHARSAAAESCPAGESCMLLLNTLSLSLSLTKTRSCCW